MARQMLRAILRRGRAQRAVKEQQARDRRGYVETPHYGAATMSCNMPA